jgi:hypothetical protein
MGDVGWHVDRPPRGGFDGFSRKFHGDQIATRIA